MIVDIPLFLLYTGVYDGGNMKEGNMEMCQGSSTTLNLERIKLIN